MSEGHTRERLKELQALPLERKVGFTCARIAEWYKHFDGKVYVSFSGGKDSTVLLHIARGLFSDIKAVFIDTGLEYPEIKEFVKTWDNVDILRPKLSFKQVVEKYGYPVISKEVAQVIREVRAQLPCYDEKGKRVYKGCRAEQLGLCEYSGKYARKENEYRLDKYAYLVDAPFKISDQCCSIMKKNPAKHYEKSTGLKPIIATMAEESLLRQSQWLKQGCNAFDRERPASTPMSFWTEQDVLKYIQLKKIRIASVYGNVVSNGLKYHVTGYRRTGCVFCLFGIKQDGCPNRIQRLSVTHPQLYNYCLNTLGLKEVMDFIKVPYEPKKPSFIKKMLEMQRNRLENK